MRCARPRAGSGGSTPWSTWPASSGERRSPRSPPATSTTLIAANLAAPYHTAVAAGRAMLEQPAADGIKGKIVNIGDWATERPYRDHLPYLVAKGGLTTMTLALAVELAPHIPVAMIQPAMIEPPPDLGDRRDPGGAGPDAAAPDRLAGRCESAHPLLARGHELRHRRLLPGRSAGGSWASSRDRSGLRRRGLREQLEMHCLLVNDKCGAGEGRRSSRTSRPIPGDG